MEPPHVRLGAQFARMEAVIIEGPVIGRLIDRYGSRVLVGVAALVTSGLVISLAFIHAEWHLMTVFVMTGLFGMGRVADVYVSPPVARWFVRRRPRAMGIALAGTPIGIVVFYPHSQFLIDRIGWRDTWLVLGIAGLVVVVPLALAVLRRGPEDLGLLPDGDMPASTEEDAVAAVAEPDHPWTRAQAVRTPAFWLMVAGFSSFTFGWSTFTIFRVPHFVKRGLDPTLVAFTIAADAVVAVAVSVLLGWRLERIPPRFGMFFGLSGLAGYGVGLIFVDNIPLLFIANIGYGFDFQTGHVAQNVMWASYFGRANLGSIRGLALPITASLDATTFPIGGGDPRCGGRLHTGLGARDRRRGAVGRVAGQRAATRPSAPVARLGEYGGTDPRCRSAEPRDEGDSRYQWRLCICRITSGSCVD